MFRWWPALGCRVGGGRPEEKQGFFFKKLVKEIGIIIPINLLSALLLHLPEEVEAPPVESLQVHKRVEGGGEAGRVPGRA